MPTARPIAEGQRGTSAATWRGSRSTHTAHPAALGTVRGAEPEGRGGSWARRGPGRSGRGTRISAHGRMSVPVTRPRSRQKSGKTPYKEGGGLCCRHREGGRKTRPRKGSGGPVPQPRPWWAPPAEPEVRGRPRDGQPDLAVTDRRPGEPGSARAKQTGPGDSTSVRSVPLGCRARSDDDPTTTTWSARGAVMQARGHVLGAEQGWEDGHEVRRPGLSPEAAWWLPQGAGGAPVAAPRTH